MTAFAVPVISSLAAQPLVSRVPGSGIQPQVVIDAEGTVHLVYFTGEPKAGDLYYTRRPAGAEQFLKPVRVNSQPGSAVAIGTIRGGQIALGKAGRIHVAWNGNGQADGHPGAPMFYTRLDERHASFEPQRDLMTFTGGLDGGGSVAADRDGNVYVAWHGIARPQDREPERAVFLTVSRDDGQTFTPERPINPEPTGACACCGLKIFADAPDLYVLYRAAREGTQRDFIALGSRDQGKTFRSLFTHAWKGTTCPMSSGWIGPAPGHTAAAWENRGRVWFANFDSRGQAGEPVSPAGSSQKHPVAAVNSKGELLLVWVEGSGWQKSGSLAWQFFDSQNKAVAPPGRGETVPVWSFAAAWAQADKGFEIIY
jgi:hypothetical protein